MPLLRATALIDAPTRTVAGLLRDRRLVAFALDGEHEPRAASGYLGVGDQLRYSVRLMPGVRIPVVTRITHAGIDALRATLVSGLPGQLEHVSTLTETVAGTLLLDEVRWRSPFGLLGRGADIALFRGTLLRLLAQRARALAAGATELLAGRVVVAAALIRDGRLLAARRSRPAELAGRWELPGGRVETGESEPDALQRECREELGVLVQIGARLGPDLAVGAGVLRAYAATVAAGEPRALDHAELRWVRPEEMTGLDWLPADRALLPDLPAPFGDVRPPGRA